MKTVRRTAMALAAAGLTIGLSGCVRVAETVETGTRGVVTGHPGGAYSPQESDRNDLENRATFVLLDKSMERRVTCGAIQERRLEDGRLELMVQVRNRRSSRVEAQIDCVFKDERGFPTGDAAPFQTLILTGYAQEGVRFVSMNPEAKRYTVRVRRPR